MDKIRILDLKSYLEKMIGNIVENKERYLGLAIVSVIGCLIFSDMLSDFIFDKLAVYHEVTVTGYPSENTEEYPAVIDNLYRSQDSALDADAVGQKKYGFYDWGKLQGAVTDKKDVTYVSQEESAYGYAYYRLDSPDAYISFRLPVYMNTCLTIVFGEQAFPVVVSDEKAGVSKFLSYGSVGSGCVKTYLYNIKNCFYVYVSFAVGYAVIFFALFFLLSCLLRLYEKFILQNKFVTQFHPWMMGVLIAGCYIGYASLQYYFHWEIFQVGEGADAYYYMNPDIWDELGHFSLEKAAAYLFSFRGYFTIVVAVATNTLSQLSGMEPIYFYFIYYGVVIAFAIVNGMPKLYKYLTGRRVTNGMCFAAYILFFLFWNNFYFYALTDIPAAMFAVLGVAWLLEGISEEKNLCIFGGSIFIGISINYRNAYNYVLYFTLLWMAIEIIQKIRKGTFHLKKVVGICGCAVCGILLISFPQAMINYTRGHIGLFTYDAGWVYDAHSGNIISAIEADFTGALHRYGIFSSPPNRDMQLYQIDQLFYADKYYSMGDMLYLVLANPLQFLLGYAKKIFWAMCIGIEGVYGAISFPDYVQVFVKLVNFYLIGNFLYVFLCDKSSKILSMKSRLWFLGMGIVTVGLQGVVHVEKRYFLFYLLLIYFMNVFVFSGYLREIKGTEKKLSCKYSICMAMFVFCSYVLEKMLEYNFA